MTTNLVSALNLLLFSRDKTSRRNGHNLNPPQGSFRPEAIQNRREEKENRRKTNRLEETGFPLASRSMADPRRKSKSLSS